MRKSSGANLSNFGAKMISRPMMRHVANDGTKMYKKVYKPVSCDFRQRISRVGAQSQQKKCQIEGRLPVSSDVRSSA